MNFFNSFSSHAMPQDTCKSLKSNIEYCMKKNEKKQRHDDDDDDNDEKKQYEEQDDVAH